MNYQVCALLLGLVSATPAAPPANTHPSITESTNGAAAEDGRLPLWRQPKAASFKWVSPWVRFRVFGLAGQVFHICIALICRFAFGFPHGSGLELLDLPLSPIYI